MSEFQLEDIKDILRNCVDYDPSHHMQRPFMSAYQVAIHFARHYPEHPTVQRLPIGGQGSGEYQSLAQRIARFLSSVIKGEQDSEIEGAFLSHGRLAEMTFKDFKGNPIRVSTLASETGHSMFRVIG